MKTSFFVTISLVLLAASLVACQSTPEEVTINEHDADKTITLNTGDMLVSDYRCQ
jgi:hypothetical protein